MFTRKLGRSGIEVSALGLGCWPIGGLILDQHQAGGESVGWGTVNDDDSIRALHHALDLGVNFFDTAAVYGRSEDILGRAFADRRDQVVIATKFGKTYDRTRHTITGVDCSPNHMRADLAGSLSRLKTDYIDLYQLHVGDCPIDQAILLREELEHVVAEGLIRSYAWSTDSIENARVFAEGPHCTAVQHSLNVFRGNVELLTFCEAHNLASVNRGPLGMGILTGKYSTSSQFSKDDVRGRTQQWMIMFQDGKPNPIYLKKLDAIRDILTSKGRTVAQGALAWLWGRSPATIPIPGFKGIQQAEENARAMEFGPLTPEQMTQIDQLLKREIELT